MHTLSELDDDDLVGLWWDLTSALITDDEVTGVLDFTAGVGTMRRSQVWGGFELRDRQRAVERELKARGLW